VVIVKYLTSTPAPTVAAGLTYSSATTGSYTYLTFTAGTGSVTF
jgi:hypothetical protein